MFYDVFINGELIGTYGHSESEHFTVTYSSSDAGTMLLGGVICSENGTSIHHSWQNLELAESDVVTISRSKSNVATEPTKKFELGRGDSKLWSEGQCDFCQRSAPEVAQVIAGDSNRPGICSECVEMCIRIIEGDA